MVPTDDSVNCGYLGMQGRDERTDGWENVQPLS